MCRVLGAAKPLDLHTATVVVRAASPCAFALSLELPVLSSARDRAHLSSCVRWLRYIYATLRTPKADREPYLTSVDQVHAKKC